MKLKNIAIGSMIAGILMCATVISAGATCVGVGTVNGDGLRLRKDPGLEAEVITSANKGDTVVVLEEKDGWYKVDFDTQTGYMSKGFVSVEASVEKDLGWAKVTTEGDPLNVRSGAGTGYGVVTKLNNGVSVKVTGLKDGWYKVTYNDKTGYVSSDYVTLTADEKGTRKDGDVVTAPQGSALGQSIVAEAMKHVGKRYVSGGKGPNAFDCSGFTYYCVKQASGGAIKLSGGSSTQWRTAPGQRINSVSELQPGDLIFIRDPAYAKGYATSHVEIYAGNGMIVHAADKRQGVVYVPLRDKDISYFVGAIRLG